MTLTDRAPKAFAAADGGPNALQTKFHTYGTTVTFSLNQKANVRFTIVQLEPGRKTKRGCAQPTKHNRGSTKCTRRMTLPGSFALAGRLSSGRFRLTGRLAGHRLRPATTC
jgi:hypothetical protein